MLAAPLVFLMAQAAVSGMTTDTERVVEGHPVLRRIVVRSVEHTHERLIRREIHVTEGDALEKDTLRAIRRRLEETGLFDRIELGATAAGPRQADLQVDLLDRHGLGEPIEILGRAGVDLVKRRLSARYVNLGGTGASLGGWYRWEPTQPSLGFRLDAVNPFGIGANLRVEALRARPSYDLGDDGSEGFTLRTRGADVGLRRVLGARTTVGLGMHYRERRYAVLRSDTPSGDVIGVETLVEHRLLDAPRHAIEVALGALRASSAWGSDLNFTRGLARAGYRASLSVPEAGFAIQRSEIALQVVLGGASVGTPLDESFAPGAATDSPFPLRAHRQKRSGVLGRVPIGRTVALGNIELRQRLIRRAAFQVGGVLFYDVGRIGETAQGRTVTLHDVGAGLRLGFGRSTVLRADIGYGLTDGKTALTAGIGQAF